MQNELTKGHRHCSRRHAVIDSQFFPAIDSYIFAGGLGRTGITIRIDGVVVRKERASAGPFSIEIAYRVPTGTNLMVNITADKLHCPARSGTGPDDRSFSIHL